MSNYQLVKNNRSDKESCSVKDTDLGEVKVGVSVSQCTKYAPVGSSCVINVSRELRRWLWGEDHFLCKEENLSPNPQHHIKVLHDHTCL